MLWYTVLDSTILTTYANTTSLIQFQNVVPIIQTEAAFNMLEKWVVFLMVNLRPGISHPAMYEITMTIGAS